MHYAFFPAVLAVVHFVPLLVVSHPYDQLYREIEKCLVDSGVSSGHIVGRNHSKYSAYNYQWNLSDGVKTPLGYLLATNSSDVQAAVKCCKPRNVRIVAKGGGHSYGKYSFGDNETLIVDLQLMDSIVVEPRRKICHSRPGLLLGPLAWTLYSQHGMVVPHGTCPTAGLSGLALGGGYGYLSRLHGLTTDNIVELEMVDATGSIVIANKDTNPDLFFVLRGAGIGSYGIVTRFSFRAYQTPENVVLGRRIYDLYAFSQVFNAWQAFLKSKPPKEVNTKFAIDNGRMYLEVFEVQQKADEIKDSRVVQNILSTFPDGETNVRSLTYPEFLLATSHAKDFGVRHASGLGNLSRHSFQQRFWRAKSFYVDKYISYLDIWSLHLLLKQMPDRGNIVIEMYAGGGAIDDLARNETAHVHRAPNIYEVQAFYSITPSPDAARKVARAHSWLAQFFKTTKQIMTHTESYQNYVDEDLKDYLQRYYGSNLERLVQIKRMMDPDNYFHTPQSIPLST